MHAAVLSLFLAASSGQPEIVFTKLLVVELQPNGVEASLAKSLSEVLVSELRSALPGASVLGQSEINSLLALEKQRDMVRCQADAPGSDTGSGSRPMASSQPTSRSTSRAGA
jgi:hypothetical protein